MIVSLKDQVELLAEKRRLFIERYPECAVAVRSREVDDRGLRGVHDFEENANEELLVRLEEGLETVRRARCDLQESVEKIRSRTQNVLATSFGHADRSKDCSWGRGGEITKDDRAYISRGEHQAIEGEEAGRIRTYTGHDRGQQERSNAKETAFFQHLVITPGEICSYLSPSFTTIDENGIGLGETPGVSQEDLKERFLKLYRNRVHTLAFYVNKASSRITQEKSQKPGASWTLEPGEILVAFVAYFQLGYLEAFLKQCTPLSPEGDNGEKSFSLAEQPGPAKLHETLLSLGRSLRDVARDQDFERERMQLIDGMKKLRSRTLTVLHSARLSPSSPQQDNQAHSEGEGFLSVLFALVVVAHALTFGNVLAPEAADGHHHLPHFFEAVKQVSFLAPVKIAALNTLCQQSLTIADEETAKGTVAEADLSRKEGGSVQAQLQTRLSSYIAASDDGPLILTVVGALRRDLKVSAFISHALSLRNAVVMGHINPRQMQERFVLLQKQLLFTDVDADGAGDLRPHEKSVSLLASIPPQQEALLDCSAEQLISCLQRATADARDFMGVQPPSRESGERGGEGENATPFFRELSFFAVLAAFLWKKALHSSCSLLPSPELQAFMNASVTPSLFDRPGASPEDAVRLLNSEARATSGSPRLSQRERQIYLVSDALCLLCAIVFEPLSREALLSAPMTALTLSLAHVRQLCSLCPDFYRDCTEGRDLLRLSLVSTIISRLTKDEKFGDKSAKEVDGSRGCWDEEAREAILRRFCFLLIAICRGSEHSVVRPIVERVLANNRCFFEWRDVDMRERMASDISIWECREHFYPLVDESNEKERKILNALEKSVLQAKMSQSSPDPASTVAFNETGESVNLTNSVAPSDSVAHIDAADQPAQGGMDESFRQWTLLPVSGLVRQMPKPAPGGYLLEMLDGNAHGLVQGGAPLSASAPPSPAGPDGPFVNGSADGVNGAQQLGGQQAFSFTNLATRVKDTGNSLTFLTARLTSAWR